MNDLHHRIRQSLAMRASSLSDQPDPQGLTDRIARRERRRRRGLSAALVLAVVVGPSLGYVAGRSEDRGGSDVATGPSGERVTVEEVPGSLPTVVPGGSAGGAPALPGSDAEAVTGGGASILATNGPLARSFVRDVDGTTIRAYRADVVAPQAGEGPSWWEPPASCFPNGYVQADVSTADAVGIVAGSLYAELPDMSVAGSLGAIGVAEGAPLWVVVAQAPAGAASVRATFPDGRSDEMESVDGVAVLVGPASIEPGGPAEHETTVALEAFDADGRSLGTGTARRGGYGTAEGGGGADASAPLSGGASAECLGPQELPPPGDEQPADPAAARAEIEGLFGIRFADRTDDERLAQLDDPTGMLEVYEQMRSGPYADQVLGSRPVFRDVVFLSATRAVVQYDTEIPGYPAEAFGQQFGEVVIVDGRWKLTREGVCRAVQNSGVTCPEVP